MTTFIFIGMSFGTELKKIRKAKGLTQAEFAEKIGVTQTAIAHYERGVKKPEMDKLPNIAKTLGVSIGELFEERAAKQKKANNIAHGNSRVTKMNELFNKLKPNEQRLILSQLDSWVKK